MATAPVSFVMDFNEIDSTMLLVVGGKGANLGELCRIKGVCVPAGFCVTTAAFKQVIETMPGIQKMLKQLSQLKPENTKGISELSRQIRESVEAFVIPEFIRQPIADKLAKMADITAFAVRSSATAEDLPGASFAGQQDSFLNITGEAAILEHISKCWASLFTERAVIYRMMNGFGHSKVSLSVIIQKMVFAEASGIMFTADPVTSNRKIISVDAGFGLGEAIVSGLTNADTYTVKNGTLQHKKISAKKLAIHALKEGGIMEMQLLLQEQNKQVLSDEEIVKLANIGRKIEAQLGAPQDIEWCLFENNFFIVQSRPITTLFPLPCANDDKKHIYVSVGHQQMMTDAMKPLGIDIWRLTAARPMAVAGGRLFVDVLPDLLLPERRNIIVNVLGKSDPAVKNAIITLLERGDFIQGENGVGIKANSNAAPTFADYQTLKDFEASVVTMLIKRGEAETKALKQKIRNKTGVELIDFILDDLQQKRKNSPDPQSFAVIMTSMNASAWINEKMYEWLGEKNVADILTQSVPDNITSAMGLDLMEVADVVRPYPEIISYLEQTKENNFLDELKRFDGGDKVLCTINMYLEKYGMRCAGEIDITRPRWAEKPTLLIPMILNNIRNFKSGESSRKFEEGFQKAKQKEQELLQQLNMLPDGQEKSAETKRMIDLMRNLAGYREYPKYNIVSRYFIYKQAMLTEAAQLKQAHILHTKEDIFYLELNELREVIRSRKVDYITVNRRKEMFRLYKKLKPPRVMTSDGEIITGNYLHKNLPAGSLAGLAVSSGIAEGRARVILHAEDAVLEEGDILVTKFTDPSWTPMFVLIKGLVTEVGGLMTHGAVIAREYGLPAVVSVENATTLIKDGERIRVHGTDGYVELL